jgi:hypothetical protein
VNKVNQQTTVPKRLNNHKQKASRHLGIVKGKDLLAAKNIAVPISDSSKRALFRESLLGPFYVRGTAAIIYPVDFKNKTQSR